MRTLRFRVWNQVAKEWSHFDLGDTKQPQVASSTYDWKTVGQFTGLFDKTSKEIYEGDFLRSGKHTVRIQWSDHVYGDAIGFGAVGLDRDTEMNVHHFCAHGEVIGNIYEHPDLLKT